MRGILFILCGIALLISGCSKSFITDEMQIRARYKIHSDTRCVESVSEPPEGSLFGREHLTVRATFQFYDPEFFDFMAKNKIAEEWAPLPIPDKVFVVLDEIDSLRKADLKRFDKIKNGYFRCETAAGKNIFLRGNERPDSHPYFLCPPGIPDKDFILAVVDGDTKQLHVVAIENY